MPDVMITIPYEDYKKMAELAGKVEALKTYTLRQKYSVDRELLADMIGFELPNREDE